jgi:hypothetical protein
MVVRKLTPAGMAVHLERIAIISPGERVDAKKSAVDVYLIWRRQQMVQGILDEVRPGLALP